LNFDIVTKDRYNIKQTVAKVKDADVVIFVGGISPFLEGEEMGVNLPGFKGGDRTDIELTFHSTRVHQAICINQGKK
jgi:beta-glucosidase